MIPTVATVPTLRFWEEELVDEIRRTGIARVVERAASPAALIAAEADIVVIGDTAPFLSPGLLRSLAADRVVVGVMTGPDQRVARMFRESNVPVFHGEVPATEVVRLALEAGRRSLRRPNQVIEVRSVRGSPGCTEVAIGLAAALGRAEPCLLVEADQMAPSVGLRLGLPPGAAMQSGPGFDVSAPFQRSGPATRSSIDRVVDGARLTHRHTVVDRGVDGGGSGDLELLVMDPSPVSLVRAARVLASGRMPVVANRVGDASGLERIRHAIGGDPQVVVPVVEVRFGGGPSERVVEALSPFAESVRDLQRSTAR